MRNLLFILGDQPTPTLSSRSGGDAKRDLVLMAGVHGEAAYVRHRQKNRADILGDAPLRARARGIVLAGASNDARLTAGDILWNMAGGRLKLKLFAFGVLALAAGSASGSEAGWISESNGYSKILLGVQAKYQPESVSSFGMEGFDSDVMDLRPESSERFEADLLAAADRLKVARARVTDPRVNEDLDILIDSATDQRRTLILQRELLVPYFDLPQSLFRGFQKLLHQGVTRERQQLALSRLRRYAGRERGYEPIAVLARARIEETFGNASLTAPWGVELRENLGNQPRFLAGIHDLFQKSGLVGWDKDFKALSAQFDGYAKWIKSGLLPRARQTNQMPEAIYADNLKNFGVEADPRALMEQALAAYSQIKEELASLAGLIAEKRGLKSTAYIDVLRDLKKDGLPNDRLLDFYRQRLKQVEAIVRSRQLATLPARDAVIRMATEAESAAIPAPHIDVPPLVGNTGQPAAFVIPLSNPTSLSAEKLDDFSFDAVTWTLIAHEARPGHELQISRMLDQGVSTARVVFAFNSANIEGWGLYAESIMKPYFPLEGQFGVLQHRLMRASRAFLDPMLNLGLIEPGAAKRLLMEEVGLSEPMAKQEVDRYTFAAPGQATAYFYGYQKMEAIRAKAEIALGERFDLLSFHDFILNQGLLPLRLLDKAVMEEYVPSRRTVLTR